VISWPVRTSIARMRPTTWVLSLMMPSALVPSSGMSERTATSPASIGLRAGIGRTATTAEIVLRPDWPACCWAWLIR
jgi:hypothetical protein